jgi:ribosomal protein S18 acetylase RimI-like enzyme
VHGDFRRHGLGSRLWEHCIGWAKNAGIQEIHVLHADSNQAIIGLCRKYGLRIERVDGERVGIWSAMSAEKKNMDSEWDLELAAC